MVMPLNHCCDNKKAVETLSFCWLYVNNQLSNMNLNNQIILDELQAFISKADEDDFAVIFAMIINRGCIMQKQRLGEELGSKTCVDCHLNFLGLCRTLYKYIEITKENLLKLNNDSEQDKEQ